MSNSSQLFDSVVSRRSLLRSLPLRFFGAFLLLGLCYLDSPVLQAQDCLENCTYNQRNVAIGFGGLFSNTTGTNNTAAGAFPLHFNTTGSFNTASGANALGNNTTGSFNTATGVSALQTNTTGGSNTATGANALFAN